MKPLLTLKPIKQTKQLISALQQEGVKFNYSYNTNGDIELTSDSNTIGISIDIIDLANLRKLSVYPIVHYRHRDGKLVLSTDQLRYVPIKLSTKEYDDFSLLAKKEHKTYRKLIVDMMTHYKKT